MQEQFQLKLLIILKSYLLLVRTPELNHLKMLELEVLGLKGAEVNLIGENSDLIL